jgi:hypothetical protein
MDDVKLSALTNQRVPVTIAGQKYTLRRANFNDVGKFNQFRYDQQQAGNVANVDLDSTFFLLSELLKPDFDFTLEQLKDSIPFEANEDIVKALEVAGFRKPQQETTTKA